jgi:hypothetical protein
MTFTNVLLESKDIFFLGFLCVALYLTYQKAFREGRTRAVELTIEHLERDNILTVHESGEVTAKVIETDMDMFQSMHDIVNYSTESSLDLEEILEEMLEGVRNVKGDRSNNEANC